MECIVVSSSHDSTPRVKKLIQYLDFDFENSSLNFTADFLITQQGAEKASLFILHRGNVPLFNATSRCEYNDFFTLLLHSVLHGKEPGKSINASLEHIIGGESLTFVPFTLSKTQGLSEGYHFLRIIGNVSGESFQKLAYKDIEYSQHRRKLIELVNGDLVLRAISNDLLTEENPYYRGLFLNFQEHTFLPDEYHLFIFNPSLDEKKLEFLPLTPDLYRGHMHIPYGNKRFADHYWSRSWTFRSDSKIRGFKLDIETVVED